jgi:3-polyprenyl-4-hydroxybenzoate decarboxylase
MERQCLIISVSGSSAAYLVRATLKALQQHPELETHLVVSNEDP